MEEKSHQQAPQLHPSRGFAKHVAKMRRQDATMLKKGFLALALAFCAGCSAPVDLSAPPVDLGDFSLGHNIVIAPKVQTASALSREATQEVLTDSLRTAIAERFDKYEGPREYHFGVSIEGYVLARAGIPVIAAPKSGMIIRVTVWDDAAGAKMNDPPEQITVLEQASGASVIGSGWSRNADEQLRDLSVAAAKAIEDFLLAQADEKGWFFPERAAALQARGEASAPGIEPLQRARPEAGAL